MPERLTKHTDGFVTAIPDAYKLDIQPSAGGVDTHFFLADEPVEVVAVREVHSVVGAAVTIDVKKCTGTQAPASGVTVLGTTFAADSTVNTVVSKRHDGLTAGTQLTATRANRKLAAGDRLAFDYSAAPTGYVGTLTVVLKKLQTPGGDI